MTNKIKVSLGFLIFLLVGILAFSFYGFSLAQPAEPQLGETEERQGVDDGQIRSTMPQVDRGEEGSRSPDLNGDGMVGTVDLEILLSSWGPCPDLVCPADLNEDGVVDGSDLLILLEAWTGDPEIDKDEIERIPERCAGITDLDHQRRCLTRLAETEETRITRERMLTERLESHRESLAQRPTVSEEEINSRIRERRAQLSAQERERAEMRREIAVEFLQRRAQIQTEVRNEVEVIRGDLSAGAIVSAEELRERRAELIALRLESAKEGVSGAVSNMFRSNRNHLERLSRVADGVQNRIEIMDEEGLDVSQARGHLSEALGVLSSAERNLSEESLQRVLREIRNTENSQELREVFSEARDLMFEVRSDLREAREILNRSIAELRNLL